MATKMLYIMNVDWDWIKQRPHFLAEQLSKYYQVEVLYRHRYNRTILHKHSTTIKLKKYKYYLIPILDRFRSLAKINDVLKRLIITRYIKRSHAEIVYITAPDQYVPYLKSYKGRIIYDCMDNHIEFSDSKERARELSCMEENLISCADLVFVSSERLRDTLQSRYHQKRDKFIIERNAFSERAHPKVKSMPLKGEKIRLAYFGTISTWFNFDFITKSLEDFPMLEYDLIGPVEGVSVPQDPRIHLRGVLPHDDLPESVANVNALIMPFVLNDITLAVDPVKLYEYLDLSKNIIAVDYPEIRRFMPYVYLYSNYDQYCDAIKKVSSGKLKYSFEDQKSFLAANTWAVRALDIHKHIGMK